MYSPKRWCVHCNYILKPVFIFRVHIITESSMVTRHKWFYSLSQITRKGHIPLDSATFKGKSKIASRSF